VATTDIKGVTVQAWHWKTLLQTKVPEPDERIQVNHKRRPDDKPHGEKDHCHEKCGVLSLALNLNMGIHELFIPAVLGFFTAKAESGRKSGGRQTEANRGLTVNGQKRNPIYRKGVRNAFCLFYKECLDEAVKKAWAFWDCSECTHRSSRDQNREIADRMNDSMPYYDVSVDINEDAC
jgi:hypothetical protein